MMKRIESDKKGGDFLVKEPVLILAVMLVMALVLMLFYIPYLEKSHLASDKRLAADIRTAMMEVLADQGAGSMTAGDVIAPAELGGGSGQESFWAAVYSRLGARSADDLNRQMKYDDGKILYFTDEEGNLFVVFDYAHKQDLVMPDTGA